KILVIFASPGMAVPNPQFNSLLSSHECHQRLLDVVVDKAYCVVQWGGPSVSAHICEA
ncbi:hypothetical protein HD554DRAFT_2026961, partial [Boletus coccyginus]